MNFLLKTLHFENEFAARIVAIAVIVDFETGFVEVEKTYRKYELTLESSKRRRMPKRSRYGSFTKFIPRITLFWRRARRLGFFFGLKTLSGLGIIAARYAASC